MTSKFQHKSKHRHLPSQRRHQEPDFVGRVRDMASDGRAVVKHPDGRLFFVSGAWLDEEVRIRPKGAQRGIGFGEVVEVINPAPVRREAPCDHHGHKDNACGGCPWMFVEYAAQCQVKQSRVVQTVAAMGASPDVIRTLWSSPNELGYRNRAQLKTDGKALGYAQKRSHTLVDVERCPVLNREVQEQLVQLRRQLPNSAWQPNYAHIKVSKRSQPRQKSPPVWRTIDIDDVSAVPRLNQRLPFRQGNSQQNTRMRQWLSKQCASMTSVAPGSDVAILELFCGAGNFTDILAATGQPVLAVEASAECLETLNAKGLSSVVTHKADLFNAASLEAVGHMAASASVLVLDPPRAGLPVRQPLLRPLKQLHTVLYISCDLATWARDCADFIDAGFQLEEVQPLDLFPQTPHIELLSRLERR